MVWLLSAKLGAVQATYMTKLEIGPQLIVRISTAYSAPTGPHHTVRIPQYTVRKFRTIGAFPQHIVRKFRTIGAFPQHIQGVS